MRCIYILKADLRFVNQLAKLPLLFSRLIYPTAAFVAITLLIIFGVFFLLIKSRNQKLLKVKQDELLSKDVTLEQLLKENEWLIRELHHRVKNNLQIVTSLLHSQSSYLKDDAAINAIMESQHRIQAMSLIHKKLYQPDSLATVFMPDYIAELVSYLMDSFNSKDIISCDLQIDEIRLQMVHAVPVGLILNEILTNALKFAFPFSEHDCITLKFFSSSPNEICLEVQDNGRGLPEGFSADDRSSFGMLLIKGLTDQLDGVFSIENSSGTTIKLSFRDKTFS